MDKASDKIATVVDYGNSVELALRLSREFKKVNYFKWWKEDKPTSNKLSVGDGFGEITRVRHLFDQKVMSETDIFIFPEIYDGDLQLDLERRGKRVWGSRMAERYEYDRELFLKTLTKVGLPFPEYEVCIGISALKSFLKDNDDWWIKVELRGDDETWHHHNWSQSQRKIESMEYRFGPIKEEIKFVCVRGIDSVIEVAYDGFMVTSPSGKVQFPDTAFQGYECKNKGHILAVTDYNDLCDEVKQVNELFAPILADKMYRSAWGTEIKVTEDTFFFLDATCRQPSPPGEIVLELVKNLGEFMWQGSGGHLIPLETEKPFASQVTLYSSWAAGNWQPFEIPEEIRRWIKIYQPSNTREGLHSVPAITNNPKPDGNESVAVVVGMGDSIEESNEMVKEYCDQITAFDSSASIEALGECLLRIKEGEKEGVHFTDQKVPNPESIM